jgi:hypothetical protein
VSGKHGDTPLAGKTMQDGAQRAIDALQYTDIYYLKIHSLLHLCLLCQFMLFC